MTMIVQKSLYGENCSEEAHLLDEAFLESSACLNPSGSFTVMSKKVKARKLTSEVENENSIQSRPLRNMTSIVYTKRPRSAAPKPSFFKSLMDRIAGEGRGIDGSVLGSTASKKGKRELHGLGVDTASCGELGGSSLRGRRFRKATIQTDELKKKSEGIQGKTGQHGARKESGLSSARKWVRLDISSVDPTAIIGCKCKVYWPLDDDWYIGSVSQFDSGNKKHQVKYDDGEIEWIVLMDEEIKFCLSKEEMSHLNVFPCEPEKARDFNELMMLATSFDDCGDFIHGEIVWAKITGHAMWPAIVMDEVHAAACKGIKHTIVDKSLPVQFFGTYDYARIKRKQIVPFYKGFLSSFHLKCKHVRFVEALEETRRYFKERVLPEKIAQLQTGVAGGSAIISEENTKESLLSDGMQQTDECADPCPFEVEGLRVIHLGKIVRDSEYFHNEKYTWPLGYCATRKFVSATDPRRVSEYKMEVLRNPKSKMLPLFRVTWDNGTQINGHSPTACWKKIYRRIRQSSSDSRECMESSIGKKSRCKSGAYMFGFCIKRVRKFIQGLPNSGNVSKSIKQKSAGEYHVGLPDDYHPVILDLKDLEKCNVCHMDEEYEDNLFLQCDKCLIVVHARCYGELEPLSEKLWLCNLCRPGAIVPPPICCLCPVIGGAMKETTDGRWAHLACAMWIPETFLVDIQKMEPIDGLSKISKDRWKLLCSICGVPYGACIQCSHKTCRIAYHPLCARADGLCVELEDEKNKLLPKSIYEEDDQCVRLVSFCKKHRKPSSGSTPNGNQTEGHFQHHSSHNFSTSGCARSEPYNFLGRRGHREPEALASASSKRLYVENRPYLVSGYRQNGMAGDASSCKNHVTEKFNQPENFQENGSKKFFSLSEKYRYMRSTLAKRLAFGKSRIHGFGVFAKCPHNAGDMVIEYVGEIVRPKIADRREHLFYNSLVGAGTYMFQIDNERVVDATKAGNIAHLINHSCEPNCYSRVITVCGDEHIIIFAKRDINSWEEITYDYRFLSINEQLRCYCGFPKCRGVVNDIEATGQVVTNSSSLLISPAS